MVKFNQYLEKNKITIWNYQYINYYQLKTYISQQDFKAFDQLLLSELKKVEQFYLSQVSVIDTKTHLDDNYEHADQLRQYILLNII